MSVCFFAGVPGAGPCSGRLVAAHLIPKQVIRREVCSVQRRSGRGRRWPVTAADRAELDAIVWDERVVVPVCGGLTGCSAHHGALDVARTLRIPRERIPASVEAFARDHGLLWYLSRTYGERAEAA